MSRPPAGPGSTVRPPAGVGAPVRAPAMPQRTAAARPSNPVRTLHPERPLPVPPSPREDRRAIRDAVRARRRAEATERRGRGGLRHPRLIAGAVVAVVALLVGVPALLAFGPVFLVRTIQVSGVSGAAATSVRSALQGELGRPVALVSEQDVATALAKVPAVERFTLVRRPPGAVEVQVVARTPIVQQRAAGGWAQLDAAHVTISVATTPTGGLPVLTMADGASSSTFATVSAALEALRAADPPVTTVRASSADDVLLTLRGGLQVQWGGAEDGAAKAEALHAALRTAAKGASLIDVSSPGVVVTR